MTAAMASSLGTQYGINRIYVTTTGNNIVYPSSANTSIKTCLAICKKFGYQYSGYIGGYLFVFFSFRILF